MIESASAWIACQLLKKSTRNRHINSHMHLLVQYSSVSLAVEDGRRLKEIQFETYYSLNMFNQPQPLNQFPYYWKVLISSSNTNLEYLHKILPLNLIFEKWTLTEEQKTGASLLANVCSQFNSLKSVKWLTLEVSCERNWVTNIPFLSSAAAKL